MVFHLTGFNSTLCLTQVVRWGKLDSRSDSPARRSGCPANLITITLFNLDIKTSFLRLHIISVHQIRFITLTLSFCKKEDVCYP